MSTSLTPSGQFERIAGTGVPTSFEDVPSEPPVAEDDEVDDGPRLSGRVALLSAGLSLLGLLAFTLPGLLLASPAEVTEVDPDVRSELVQRTRLAETRLQALPSTQRAERGAVLASQAAARVADLQNDYRITAAYGPGSDRTLGVATYLGRNIRPYFASSVDVAVSDAWYLLSEDQDVPTGTGDPLSFESGFTWSVAQTGLVDADGGMPVTWVAREVSAEGGSGTVLAWVEATYDLERNVFIDVNQWVTADGALAQLEAEE